MKYNYQIMFSLAKNNTKTLVFAGETTKGLRPLIQECLDILDSNFVERMNQEFPMIQCYYQPIKENENETQTQK